MSLSPRISSLPNRGELSREAILSQLTLVVLTYNRPAMVQRLVNYLRTRAPEISLVLVDHGDAESQESNARAAASHSPAIRHFRLPEEMAFLDVLVRAADEFSGPYSAFCPDDDIPVIDGMADAVSMLSADPRMVCAQGYVLSLSETDSAMYFGPVGDFVPSFDDEAPLTRLFSMMRRYQPVFFGFYRTEILLWAIREFVAAKIPGLMLQEFFHAALVCSRGTIGRSPSISLWRRLAGSHTDRRMIHPFHQLVDNPTTLAARYLEFRDKLVPYYIGDARAVPPDAELGVCRLIDLVFVQYFVRHIDYAELDGKIRELLVDPGKDYFATLAAQEQAFATGDFVAVPDFCDIDVRVSKGLFEQAAQVTRELSTGIIDQGREQRISSEMLIDAIKSALHYRFGR